MNTHRADQTTTGTPDPTRGFTVFGITENDRPPRRLWVAAVVAGDVTALDEDYGSDSWERWGRHFPDATTPAEAERLAVASVAPPAETEDEDEAPARVWNTHSNDLGDWCPHSGDPVPAEDDDDAACPAGCRSSYPTDDED